MKSYTEGLQYNTALQILLMGVTTVSPLVPHDIYPALQGLQYVLFAWYDVAGADNHFQDGLLE